MGESVIHDHSIPRVPVPLGGAHAGGRLTPARRCAYCPGSVWRRSGSYSPAGPADGKGGRIKKFLNFLNMQHRSDDVVHTIRALPWVESVRLRCATNSRTNPNNSKCVMPGLQWGRYVMPDEEFQHVPVPSRFVLRVMECLVKWEAAERPAGTDSPEEDGWPVDLLRKIGKEDVKSLTILTQLLDRMAKNPGKFYALSDLASATDYPHGSVSAAIRKLPAYFKSRFARDDFPFTRSDNKYGLTPAQASRWTEARHG
jgi:hypothetical protein